MKKYMTAKLTSVELRSEERFAMECIVGSCYNDTNGNGMQDANEPIIYVTPSAS